MRKLLFVLWTLLLIAFAFGSCTKDGDDGDTWGSDADSDSDSDNDTDADADTDTDADADTDTDADADADADTDTDTDSDTDTEDRTCNAAPYDVKLQDINILILMDRSKSMVLDESKFDDGRTYEQALDAALKDVVLSEENKLVNFGLAVFPAMECVRSGATSAAQVCYPTNRVEVPIGFNMGTEISNQLDAIDACGGTPIGASLKWIAEQYLPTLPVNLKDKPTSILLATDGAPNCSPLFDPKAEPATCINTGSETNLISEHCLDDSATYQVATTLFTNGITTYVVGVGNDAAQWESVMENIAKSGSGGVNSYFQVDDPTAISNAFKNIVADATSCNFPIEWDQVPVNDDVKYCAFVDIAEEVNGEVPEDGSTAIKYSSDCSNPNGWRYEEVENIDGSMTPSNTPCNTVVLCENLCNRLKYNEIEGLSFKFGCLPPPV